MKQLKFLKTVSFEGKPIWYKDCIYQVVEESVNSVNRTTYKLFCEDLKLRGIDSVLEGSFFTVITIEEKAKEVKTEITENQPKKKNTKKKYNKN